MKIFLLAMLLLLVGLPSHAQLLYTEPQVIAYTKSIDLQILDPSLPSQRLEDWLQSGPPHAQVVHWEVADTCDLKPNEQSEDLSLIHI